ncbi:Hypothetical predicted protein [Mytilus galloprovincialis]|uniref:Reverse transcriptase domain-containing protein n=1 Tax=Mytilus galloprovincialis TaxID=29158 RepID=A0A8B6C0I0_MYTGA|nr:Hypothetical predicted protein [Mytilus galloprovincialis]
MVLVNKVKFEDVKVAKQYITNKSVGFLFDLKAGYHHIDIFAPHQKYLGFSWKFEGVEKYYVFTVLPFGLKSSGYVFTKVLRPLVAHWRRKGIKIVVYLDDGLGLADDSEVCKLHADIVKSDLIMSGFVPNREKSIWSPSYSLKWLGLYGFTKMCVANSRVPKYWICKNA